MDEDKNRKEIILITEDTGSGKNLYDKINIGLFRSRIYVTDTALDKKETGGNTKFLEKVDGLISSGIIGSGSIVFLAFDNAAIAEKSVSLMGLTKKQIRKIKKRTEYLSYKLSECSSHIADAGAISVISTYLCIEEVILSYFKLWDITTPGQGNYKCTAYEEELLQIYNEMRTKDSEILYGRTQPDNSFYIAYFWDIIHKYNKTEEQIFSDMLYAITRRNMFADFGFTKSRIGLCLYAPCSAISGTRKVDCSECVLECNAEYAYLKSKQEKLTDIVKNSRIHGIFTAIKEAKQQFYAV